MKTYEGENIRNVAVIGHSHSGKTSLVSALLFTAGAHPRLGRVDDGTTVTDYDEEEIARQMTISASLAAVEWSKAKINLIDTPGFNMFVHEAELAMPAVDAALVVVDSVSGVQVVTQKIWNFADKLFFPAIVVCTRMDRERADFERVMDSLTSTFGRNVVPVQLPIGSRKELQGRDRSGQDEGLLLRDRRQRQRPRRRDPRRHGRAGQSRARELSSNSSPKAMTNSWSEFFDTGTIAEEHIVSGIHNAIREDRLFPVSSPPASATSAATRSSTSSSTTFPRPPSAKPSQASPPRQMASLRAQNRRLRAALALRLQDRQRSLCGTHFLLQGRQSACSKMTPRSPISPAARAEKFAHISVILGKTTVPVNEFSCRRHGRRGQAQGNPHRRHSGRQGRAHPVSRPSTLPEPAITFAIEPKTRADEDKLGVDLSKLMEEDAMLRFFRDPQTQDFLIAGTGQQHIEVAVTKMKNRYHTEVILKAPKVPYRETIRGHADVQGRHKKQSGGHGQFGDCKIKMEPLPRGGQFEFVNDIFGGAIPKNYHSRRRKGHPRSRRPRIPGRLSRGGLQGNALRRQLS